jgi:hypothetical protein
MNPLYYPTAVSARKVLEWVEELCPSLEYNLLLIPEKVVAWFFPVSHPRYVLDITNKKTERSERFSAGLLAWQIANDPQAKTRFAAELRGAGLM